MIDRDVIVHMRISTQEREACEAAAASEGLKLSTWLRRLALLEARRAGGEPKPRKERSA